jgi:cholecystokinin A receptor/cholecystokinin-like receptor
MTTGKMNYTEAAMNEKFETYENILDICTNVSCKNSAKNILKSTAFKSPPLNLADKITLPFYTLIFIIAILGNLLVILTLIQNRRMRTVTNVFLFNLSVSNLLLAVFCMPFTIVPIMLKNFIFGAKMCVLIRYMQSKYKIICFN